MKVVRDRRWEGRAEYRNGRCVDDPRPVAVAGRADGFEQGAGAVEIDVVALVEIELRLARDDAGEMEDDVGTARDRLGGFAGRRQIGRDGLDLAAEARRLCR